MFCCKQLSFLYNTGAPGATWTHQHTEMLRGPKCRQKYPRRCASSVSLSLFPSQDPGGGKGQGLSSYAPVLFGIRDRTRNLQWQEGGGIIVVFPVRVADPEFL